MNQFTKGPWTSRKEIGSPDFQILDADGKVIAFCKKHDAPVLTAAPDLYEALQEGEGLIRGDLVGVEWKLACKAFLDKARAALSKVTA